MTVGDAAVPLPDGEWVVGRSSDADVRIDDDRVSRRHAVLRSGPRGWEMIDGGSLNGIWVGGEQVQRVIVPVNGVTVLVGGSDGVPVRLVPARAEVPGAAPGTGAEPAGPSPEPGTSPAGVRFQHVTPQWRGWQAEGGVPEPPAEPGGRLRAFVRHAVEATRARTRRGDGDRR